jgi:uncharacterized protein (DUF427 family)
MTTIIVKDITRNEVVAQGELKVDVIEHEGSFYFTPDQVNADHLIITERIYKCPYKGVSHWVDLQTEDGVVPDVGWVYTNPRPGYEHFQDKFGFAFGMRPGICVEKSRKSGKVADATD